MKVNKLVYLAVGGALIIASGCSSLNKSCKKEDAGSSAQEISKLQEIINDQQSQLRDLNDQLETCKKKLKIYERQPNLK